MKVVTHDRGEIIHLAALLGLSPALRDGAPAFSTGHDPALRRCGWEPFFTALEARGLEPAFDTDDPAAAALLPRAEAKPLERGHASPGEALAHSGRFLRALLRRP
jgi:hypothetical protein